MSAASTKANGRHVEHLDDLTSATMLCDVERTRRPPEKADRDRLDPEWAEGFIQAEQDGRSGTDRWLKTVRTRNPSRHAEIFEAIERARESAKADVVDDPIAGQVEGDPWESPTLGSPPPAVPFPVDVLPPQLADLVVDVANVLSSPVDFVAVAALFTASTATGRSVSLEMMEDSWWEVPSAYYALVGVSGMSKSPAIMKMTRPLWDIAREESKEWKANTERESRKKEDDDKQDVPPLKRTVVDETTIEGLAPILRDNPRGVGQIRDELTALVSGMNQYKGGKGSDRQSYLSADSGSPWSIDRRTNPDGMPLVVPHPCLSIIGGLVNSKLAALSDAKDRDDGFLERLLFTVPEPVRVRWPEKKVDRQLIEDWEQTVRRLWGNPMVECEESPRSYVVKFEPAASTIFMDWFNAHAEETENLDFPEHLGGTWSKMRGKCGRLALLINLLTWAYDPTEGDRPGDVSVSSVRAAIRLIDYFKAHARRAHALMRGSGGDDNEDARAILKWVHKTERRDFNERLARLTFEGRFPTNGPELDLAIAWLKARRCVRPLPIPPIGPKGGRRRSPAYEVNPALLNPTLRKPEGSAG